MTDGRADKLEAAAYGGPGWSPRTADHLAELGSVWAEYAIDSEWRTLRAVVVHRPGPELAAALDDPDAFQMLAPVDPARAANEHDAMVAAYRDVGVTVYEVDPVRPPPPNLMFCADLFVMTPAGAILARPASTVRAGEERTIAQRLAAIGVPILRSLTGTATFEGADLMWLDETSALIGRGPRTNQAGIDQVTATLAEIGCTITPVDLPHGAMHLMGLLRIVDGDLAIAWPRRTPHAAVIALRERGYQVVFPRLEEQAEHYRAMNFVTLGPRSILMPAGSEDIRAEVEKLGVDVITTPTDELSKAAGNTGCLTGVLGRESA